MSIETTILYQEMRRRASELPAAPQGLVEEFDQLRTIIEEHGKYIVLVFPEYTPHDHTRHINQLFALADRILGTALYQRLGSAELVLLAFGLYSHDWGMAVSRAEREALVSGIGGHDFALLNDEPRRAQAFLSEANLAGNTPEAAWRDYVRHTHGLRSGARLRRHLQPWGTVFADAVSKIAEGHTLNPRDVRDPERYPLSLSVLGEAVNIAALTTYVRIVDLLDIGEDRTPYALWKFVAPVDMYSKREWQKHRALSPVAVRQGPALREALVSGYTDDPEVFAALADLQSWVDEQFAAAVTQIRTISGKYDLDLDSRIVWSISASGFEPLTVRFETDRSEVLRLLGSELYQDDPLAFVRELLQNSVDAIDLREAVLAGHGSALKGEIRVRLITSASGLRIEWKDNGIGMDDDVLASFFARIGRSWYRSREAARLGHIDAISHFGVGILSCFAVSHRMEVETLRDPQVGTLRPGLVVEIPTCESHFRIRTATGIPVGTTIRLDVPLDFCATVSEESVCFALARIGRYVRHRITIDLDSGVEVEVGLLGSAPVFDGESSSPKVTILGMRSDSAEKLLSRTDTVVLQIGDPSGEFYGHYSAVFPKRPSEAKRSAEYTGWYLDNEYIELNAVLVDSEQALFVKGVRAGPVTKGRPWTNIFSSPYTDWIRPKLLVSVRRPSLVEFNLARSAVRLKPGDWLVEMWREIVRKLGETVFTCRSQNASDMAAALGACAEFGGVPDFGLDALVEESETPILVVRPGEGPRWVVLKEFLASRDLFIEGPFELGFAFRGLTFQSIVGLEGWEGDCALFPAEGIDRNPYPSLKRALEFGHRALRRYGWQPSAIRIVSPPATESIPLVCRVWRNSGGSQNGYEGSEESEENMKGCEILKGLYKEAPEILQFPASLKQYAAFGSRYWNVDHPKIGRVVKALLELVERKRQRRLSSGRLERLAYLTSNKFYGYIVPSRKSNSRLALEVPNCLLDIAEEEGLSRAERIVEEDFVPGTIGTYENPYHYDFRQWRTRGAGLGQNLDEVTEQPGKGARKAPKKGAKKGAR